MKIKNIFVFGVHSVADVVTNSSSELFVCTGFDTKEQILELIYEFARDMEEPMSPEECGFGSIDVYTRDEFIEYLEKNDYLTNYYHIEIPRKFKGGIIITIHSEDDNSIPWEIQQFIESELGCTRYHLG